MNSIKTKVLDEIFEHLSGSQGRDLKGLLDESMAAPSIVESEDPKGLKIESLEVMGGPTSYDDKVNQAIGEVASNNQSPRIDPKKAAQFEKGFNESGFQPERWKKNLKEGLGLSASNADLGESMTEPEMSDEELDELMRRYNA